MKRLLAVTTFVLAFVLVFASSVRAQQLGPPQCGGVQQATQKIVGDENPIVYKNHGAYVSAVSTIVGQAVQAGLITDSCSGCIVNQFAS